LRRAAKGGGLVVIDEIARMELASDEFVRALETVLARRGPIVATVHVHEHPVTDALLRRPDVEVIQVTEENRDELPTLLCARFAKS